LPEWRSGSRRLQKCGVEAAIGSVQRWRCPCYLGSRRLQYHHFAPQHAQALARVLWDGRLNTASAAKILPIGLAARAASPGLTGLSHMEPCAFEEEDAHSRRESGRSTVKLMVRDGSERLIGKSCKRALLGGSAQRRWAATAATELFLRCITPFGFVCASGRTRVASVARLEGGWSAQRSHFWCF
jgi:hypothetical protein